ncbi:MAG: trigger factor [Phycisphaerales bacterium]|nr:trigger factor [Phycisphaerales bacterium]
MADEDLQDPRMDEDGEVEAQDAESAADENEEKSLEEQIKDAVDVRVEDLGTLRKKLTITVPRDSLSEQLDKQYNELRKEAQVPGFRRGRAPRRLLEKRFGGEVSDTLVQQLVSAGYSAALDKADLKAIGDPLIWAREKGAETDSLMEVEKAIDLIELPADEPLVFSCEVEIRPEFELPDMETMTLKKPAVTISEQDIEQYVERIRAMRGSWEPVLDEPVRIDDVVHADIKMTSGETVLKSQDNVRIPVRPQTVDGVVIENLGEVLAGANIGDIRTTSGTLSDDYFKVEFRGQPVDFEFKIHRIERLHLPELNDEFAKGLGFDSLADIREWAKNDLESRLHEQTQRALAGQVCQYLLDNTSFDLPQRLSDRQVARVIMRRMVDMYQQGIPPAEVEKLMDEVRTSAQADVARDLKLSLIMEKLDEQLQVEVGENEINGRIAAIARMQNRRFDRVRDELIKGAGLSNLYVQIRDDKIVAKLIEQAKVLDEEPAKDAKDKS